MTREFLEDFRDFILEALSVQRTASTKHSGNAVAQAFYNGRIGTLEQFYGFINRSLKDTEDMTMEKVKLEFGEMVDLSKIEKKDRVKEDSMQARIIKEAENVKPGKARVVKTDVKWGSFSNAVYKLVRQGKLPEGYVPIEDKHGKQYLALDPSKKENGKK